MRAIFIAGTDTEVGKTIVSCGLLRRLDQISHRAIGMKPIAAGAMSTKDGLRNEDALALSACSNVTVPYERTNPFVFRAPTSPDIAAAADRSCVRLESIVSAYQHCLEAADTVIVEGIGGWRVPLSASLQTVDLVRALNLPVVLVCGVRLGCINHSLLSAEAICADGVELLGWVANVVDPDYAYQDESIATLESQMPAPLLAQIAWQLPVDTAKIDVALKPVTDAFWPNISAPDE